jgi:hypothetical protein
MIEKIHMDDTFRPQMEALVDKTFELRIKPTQESGKLEDVIDNILWKTNRDKAIKKDLAQAIRAYFKEKIWTCSKCGKTENMLKEKAECQHDWEYSSPPHRDQRCKKCREHRIEPEKKVSDPSAQLEDDIHSIKSEKAERCPDCQGKGYYHCVLMKCSIEHTCPKCNGTGKLSTSREDEIQKIIAITLAECGHPLNDGTAKKLAHAIMECLK